VSARRSTPAAEVKRVNLALQGGGAHGAFTWGVLDRLIEDGRIAVDSISSTSAGAINAAVFVTGLAQGGPQAARLALEKFWRTLSHASATSPLQRSFFDRMTGFLRGDPWSFDRSPSYFFLDVLARFASPYELNPFNFNPLRQIVEDAVDFDLIRRYDDVRLFVSATNVHTGKVRVFTRDDLSLDAVMASACLPQVCQAVEIDGAPYWDGGYMGNPPLFPLFEGSRTADTILVQVNPIERHETPRTAREILNRLNEITFNATLMRELRMIDFVTRQIDKGRLDSNRFVRVLMHQISAEAAVGTLSDSSKLNAEWDFITHLRDAGRAAADAFLAARWGDLGRRATLDIAAMID
jgi:NTE family protein